MDLASVFKVMDDLANDSATAIRRDSSVKMNRSMRAVRANKRAGNCAFERLGTSPAKGRDDTRGLLLTFCAKVVVRSDYRRANRANRRVKQRGQLAQTPKMFEPRHISTTRA